ncbi:MAG TPA: helix-turn-helix domain-containing protein [Anaerohalosphaeraceae bacterium]|nr:helix-turn-helix domain-containing protein [Anaerohalosphaeraceae bacterium]
MTENKDSISPKQEQAILALLDSKSIREAARKAQVSERQLFRWIKEPVFDAAYRKARAKIFETSVSRLQAVSTKAIDTLEKVLDSKKAHPSTKVSAARCVLENVRKAVELDELSVKLENIERALHEFETKDKRPFGGRRANGS